jgi:hypothetical protein
MRRIGFPAVIVLALLLAFAREPRAQVVSAQQGATRAVAAGIVPISPSVVATYQFSAGDATLVRLQSLVLWRGSAGWYTRRPANPAPVPPPPIIGTTLWVTRSSMGGVDLSVTSDTAASILLVREKSLDLRQGNVVLMDFVDGPQGPTLVDTFRVEAQVRDMNSAELLVPVLSSVPELSAFLRCDVALPAGAPGAAGNLCARVTR